ncbi:MAG: IcmT/TraK family protein [Alphaproteobacteria bacterium]|nr:IcmT/TraK family protein [Alphaproteobacteria bacterium]
MAIHWRNSQKQARFFALDARAFASVFLFLIHARLWTFIFALVIMAIFWIVERRGLTFESALRAARSWFLGRRRPAFIKTDRRTSIDFE